MDSLAPPPQPRREVGTERLSVVTFPPEPTADEWRARCLLALALINHRRTRFGLVHRDTAAVHAALNGLWDGDA